jgi:hypothetical protein
MNYRDAAITKRPREVVEYRPIGRLVAVLLLGVALSLSFFMLFNASVVGRSSHLDCDRGGLHACVLVREYGPLSTRTVFPLDSIAQVEIRGHSSKSGTKYSVDLALRNGEHFQLSRAGNRNYAELTRTVVADFVEGRAASPTNIPIDEASPFGGLVMALFSIAIGTFSLLLLGYARLEFDLDGDRILYERRRFPLRAVRRTLRAEDVQCARVTQRPGSKGGTLYSVSIALAGGEELPLLGRAGSSDKSRHYDVANRINTILAKIREERGR